MHFSIFFFRMTNQKEKKTSTLTSDQNQDQRGGDSKSQSGSSVEKFYK